jgi:endonuclease/exonuclease/phosphatase family metal-dependent hydrolase
MTLRIGTYNIRNGDGGESLGGMAALIIDARLDIVGLQEVDVGVPRSKGLDLARELSDRSGLPYYAFGDSIALDGGLYGNAVLSRHPILSYKRHYLDSGTAEQRSALHCVIGADRRKISFFNTHLALDREWRDVQLPQINTLLKRHAPFVLTGDFNVGGFDEYGTLDNVSMASTRQAPFLTFERTDAIDNIIVSDGWRVSGVTMIESRYSDHDLLCCTVETAD